MKTATMSVQVHDFRELSGEVQSKVVQDILTQEDTCYYLDIVFQEKAELRIEDYKQHILNAVFTTGDVDYNYRGFCSQGDGGSFTVTKLFNIEVKHDDENSMFVFGNSDPFENRDDLAIYGGIPCNMTYYIKEELEKENVTMENILEFLNCALFDLYRRSNHYVHEQTIECVPYGNTYSLLQYVGEVEEPLKIEEYGHKLLTEMSLALTEIFQDLSKALYRDLNEAYDNIFLSEDYVRHILESSDAWCLYATSEEEFLGFTKEGVKVIVPRGYTLECVTIERGDDNV